MRKNLVFHLLWLLAFPIAVHASFIESTIGTAIVNDATATYYNPAALTLLKNPQLITLGSIAYFNSNFSGQVTQTSTGFTQSGSTNSKTNYYLPALYLGLPATDKVTIGLAVVSNYFNRDVDAQSILRYVESSNSIQDIDIVPAIGVKFNPFFSLGAGINVSHAKFILQPTIGFPSLNIPDSESRNQCDGTGLGGDIGFLFEPTQSTLIGLNYRSAITYHLSGTSVFHGVTDVVSNDYRQTFWTPARGVLSIGHLITPNFGVMGTLHRIQWSIFQKVNVHGIAVLVGGQPQIVNATIPYHLHDTWALTLGSHYRMTPKWVIRAAGSYNQTPGNGHYQLSEGDSIILGVSTGYEINKFLTVDGSYAYSIIQNQAIHIKTTRNTVNGVNKGFRDGVSLKLTFNV